MAFGKRIKFFRNRKGMKQKELGELLGFLGKTSDVRVAQYETEARTPKADLVKEMAQIGARVLLENMRRSSRIAITGGTTMAALVEAMPYTAVQKAEMVLPARGSIGRKLELQADTLAAKLAEKAGADYRMLHLR